MKKGNIKKANNTDSLKFDINVVKQFIRDNKTAKLYIGCDSIRLKTKVKFATVICIHYEGLHGAKVFGDITYKDVKDDNLSKPINRMLTEVSLVIDMYNRLEDVLIERIDDLQVHLDINPDKDEGSNVAYGSAMGMIKGTIGITPLMKPEAFSASFCADRYCRIGL